ncbi:tetratricopeptide repeat protein, partial [Leucothrix pacifica]
MPTTSAANELTFKEIIAELTEFQEYFTDEDKSKALADWLSEACGIEGKAARLAIRNLAPLVLASLAGTGKVVGKAWMLKLHDKLGEYSWYFNLAQGILNTLKTKTDKTLGEAFEIPSNKNLGKLVSDYARWENLSTEQQGLVQLLLGQNHQAEALEASNRQHQIVIGQLSNIIDSLAFDLDLKTPEFLITEAEKALNHQAQKSSAAWLTYTSRQAKLIGREHSLELLNDFFDADKTFSWLVITGDGGTGKSRLALDALLSRQSYCDVGFLHSDKLDKSDALDNWQPTRPTIITIDYAAEYPTQIANWIDHFIQHQDDYDFPVRLLVLERVAKDQSWWKTLVSSSSSATNRHSYLYTQEPLELLPLTRTEQRQALESFLVSLDCQKALPEQDSEFWNSLDTLSNHGRPLFIGMVASAIEHNDIHKIRDWTQAELLKHVLDREEKRWAAVLSDYSESDKASIYKLLTIATLSGGLDLENDEDRIFDILNDTDIADTENKLERFIDVIKQLSSNQNGALQPDIFAEYFLLQDSEYKTGGFTRSLRKSLVTAQTISPQNTHAFISRTAIDYIKGFKRAKDGEYTEDITAFNWWKHLFDTTINSETKEPLEELTATAFNTISQLSLLGHRRTILDNWLPQLMQLEDAKTQARTLNWKGLLHNYLGQYNLALEHYQKSSAIYKELGDKSGEGTTLNNISQIFKARGDYETALTYLQQSLDIQQEIGDKSGEGTTLNNISQIYDARGDYETALTYLQQSLDIRQEIGQGNRLK